MNRISERYNILIKDFEVDIAYLKEKKSLGHKEVTKSNWSFDESTGPENIDVTISNYQKKLNALKCGV